MREMRILPICVCIPRNKRMRPVCGTIWAWKEVIYMSVPNKDEMEGKWEKTKGWVKDKAGEVTNDPDLEARGEAQRAAGNTQEAWGKVKRGVGDAVKAVGDAIDD